MLFRSISDAQAQGIMANYRNAAAPVDKWAGNPATPALAMPWKSSNTGTSASGIDSSANKFMSPEDKLRDIQKSVAKSASGATSPEDSRVADNWRAEESILGRGLEGPGYEYGGSKEDAERALTAPKPYIDNPSMVDPIESRNSGGIPYMPIMGGNLEYTPEQQDRKSTRLNSSHT